jgi:hypothetical protein
MNTFKVLKMGTECKDLATGLVGQITHWLMGMSGTITYFLQAKGLDSKGQPLGKLYMPVERLEVDADDFEEIDIPFNILGTIVTDDASGFTGMATSLVCHRNGCFHVTIQPHGVVEKTGKPIGQREFDIRGCSGEQIPAMTAAEQKQSEKAHPSPTGDRMPKIREG